MFEAIIDFIEWFFGDPESIIACVICVTIGNLNTIGLLMLIDKLKDKIDDKMKLRKEFETWCVENGRIKEKVPVQEYKG